MGKFWNEFKNFATKGKAVDLSIGVLIGNTFSKVISSIVSDVVMPVLGLFVNFDNYKKFKIPLGHDGGAIAIGSLIDNLINLLVVTITLFLFVKAINKVREEDVVNLSGEPSKPEDVKLLEEIRDLLKNNTQNQN